MRVKPFVLLAPLTVAVLVALTAASPAHAAFKPCKKGKAPLCGAVSVPLDRSGGLKGTVKLSVLRIPARKGPAAGTIMLLAGGPGQGAIDTAPLLAPLLKSLPNYDFVTFDQRGTGSSGRLRCKGLDTGSKGSPTKAAAKCAKALGSRRGYYRSYDSSEDIESVRQAIGSPKLSLYSVSYGGRVAGEYVRRHPASVARQVLDSPSSLGGGDPFNRETGEALPRVLDSIAPGTATVVSRLAAKLAKRPLRGSVVTSKGKRKRGRLRQRELYGVITSLDTEPVLRRQIPGAAAAALKGDTAPLFRLAARGGEGPKGFSEPLFLATSCAEAQLPWNTSQPPGKARTAGVDAALKLLGPSPFAPFSPSAVVTAANLVLPCLAWPAVPAAPAIPGPPAPAPVPTPPPAAPPAPPVAPQPPPNDNPQPPRAGVRGQAAQATGGQSPVPTLILEGAQDLRTPLEQGRRIAAGYSAASLLTIPYTGHSTFGNDVAKCAPAAAALFIGGGAVPAACPAKPRPKDARVTPAFPARLGALGRKRSRRARTVIAARLTVDDVVAELNRTGSRRFGGLRGGQASVRKKTFRLTRYQYIRGVRVSGRLRLAKGTLRGSVRIAGGGTVPARVTFKGSKVKTRFAGASAASVSRWNPPRLVPRRIADAIRVLRRSQPPSTP